MVKSRLKGPLAQLARRTKAAASIFKAISKSRGADFETPNAWANWCRNLIWLYESEAWQSIADEIAAHPPRTRGYKRFAQPEVKPVDPVVNCDYGPAFVAEHGVSIEGQREYLKTAALSAISHSNPTSFATPNVWMRWVQLLAAAALSGKARDVDNVMSLGTPQ